jgi:hypothetical protein
VTARELLKTINPDEVIAALERIAELEQDTMPLVIALLAVAEKKKIYLKLGFGSLRRLCTQRLGYSRDAADDRICVARAVLIHEEILDDLESRALSPSAVRRLAPHLTGGPIGAELLQAARYQSCSEIDALIAFRFPETRAPRDRVRIKPLGDGRAKLEIVLSAEVADKLRCAQELSRTSDTADLDEFLAGALDCWMASHEGESRIDTTTLEAGGEGSTTDSAKRSVGPKDIEPPETTAEREKEPTPASRASEMPETKQSDDEPRSKLGARGATRTRAAAPTIVDGQIAVPPRLRARDLLLAAMLGGDRLALTDLVLPARLRELWLIVRLE